MALPKRPLRRGDRVYYNDHPSTNPKFRNKWFIVTKDSVLHNEAVVLSEEPDFYVRAAIEVSFSEYGDRWAYDYIQEDATAIFTN